MKYKILIAFLSLTFAFFSCSEEDNCPDGSQCCTYPTPGAQIVSITVPMDCNCPPNTTFSGDVDVHYNLKICNCKNCGH